MKARVKQAAGSNGKTIARSTGEQDEQKGIDQEICGDRRNGSDSIVRDRMRFGGIVAECVIGYRAINAGEERQTDGSFESRPESAQASQRGRHSSCLRNI